MSTLENFVNFILKSFWKDAIIKVREVNPDANI